VGGADAEGGMMFSQLNVRNFVIVSHPNQNRESTRLIGESSAVGDYDDSLDNPGSSYLWVGAAHHLNREEVRELIARMQYWLDRGHLELDHKKEPE
jgi:hypothetical protein